MTDLSIPVTNSLFLMDSIRKRTGGPHGGESVVNLDSRSTFHVVPFFER